MHQLEQRVLNQKQLIESVIDAAPMAIALLDENGKVVLDNHAYKKLVTDLGVPEPADLLLAALSKSTTPGKCDGVDVRIDRAGGRAPYWFCCTTQLIEMHNEDADSFFDHPRQPSLLLIASDLTALHEEQEKARTSALKAMLAEEEHAATLHESLSAALYQIEEPINVIASALSLMRGRGESTVSGVLEGALAGARARIDELRQSQRGRARRSRYCHPAPAGQWHHHRLATRTRVAEAAGQPAATAQRRKDTARQCHRCHRRGA
jgi:nitrogen fixation negative regulator NifL